MSLVRDTGLSLLILCGLVAACGHLPMDELPLAQDDLSSDGGDRDGSSGGVPPDASSGGSDGSSGGVTDASRDRDVPPPFDDGGFPLPDGSSIDAGPPEGCTAVACYVDSHAKSNGTGSKRNPFRKLQDGIDAAKNGGLTQVFVAEGTYREKPKLFDTLQLSGGWLCAASLQCAWTQQVKQNGNTIIEAQDSEGFVVPTGISGKTVIEGFRIVGLGKTTSNTGAFGARAMTITGGSPTLRNVEILSGDVSGPPGTAIATALHITSGNPFLDDCRVEAGNAEVQSVGILLDNKNDSSLGTPSMQMKNGSVAAGEAGVSIAVLANVSDGQTSVERVDLWSAPAKQYSWAAVVTGSLKVTNCFINMPARTNIADPQVPNALRQFCPPSEFCGGIKSIGGTLTVRSSYVGGLPSARSTGLLLTDSNANPGNVEITNNTIDGGGARVNVNSDISASIIVKNLGSGSLVTGKVRNNILGGGTNKTRINVLELAEGSGSAHLASLDNNCFYQPGSVLAQSDAAYRYYEPGITPSPQAVAYASLKTVVKKPIPTNNTDEPPLFTDLNPQLHISAQSKLVNAGLDIDATGTDVDGKDPRKLGESVDIGADEVR